jgi:tetratricopeptide (TPR) repeat protein
MSDMYCRRDTAHLINLIGKRSNNIPNFALLIGAGASVSSGVRATSDMINEWRLQLYRQAKTNEPLDEWLSKQDWHNDEEEYSLLFEKVYDKASQRRVYIEECVKDAKPAWGYIYLANTIAHNFFNVVLTPNFDDLLNEACFVYADCRPIVCAHDSAVADIRVTSTRPKIIKLHGDFLYDSIKNTIRETTSLEKNMQDKFMQFAREYGLVVIGYGGNDRSIMDILDVLARSDGYLPNGLYWCMKKDSKIGRKLDRLLRRENVYLVEIDNFDGFMAELHEGLGLRLPDTVRDPYKATTEKVNRFILSDREDTHPIIKKDIKELEKQIDGFEKSIRQRATTLRRLVPNIFLAEREARRGNYEKAIDYLEKEAPKDPTNLMINVRLFDVYRLAEKFEKAAEIAEKMIKQNPDSYVWYETKGRAVAYYRPDEAISCFDQALNHTQDPSARQTIFSNKSNAYLLAGKWEKAIAEADKALEINPHDYVAKLNKSVALKRMGKKEESENLAKEALPEAEASKYHTAIAFGLLGDKKNMLNQLRAAIKQDKKYRVWARLDEDLADFREDIGFRRVVSML